MPSTNINILDLPIIIGLLEINTTRQGNFFLSNSNKEMLFKGNKYVGLSGFLNWDIEGPHLSINIDMVPPFPVSVYKEDVLATLNILHLQSGESKELFFKEWFAPAVADSGRGLVLRNRRLDLIPGEGIIDQMKKRFSSSF